MQKTGKNCLAVAKGMKALGGGGSKSLHKPRRNTSPSEMENS